MRGKTMQKMQHKMKVAPFSQHEQILISKIRVLPPERALEVEDFIDFLSQASEDRQLRLAAARLSEDAFSKVWDNPEDAEYDSL
jgi:hypothetical protein